MSGQFYPSSLRSSGSGWGDLPADLLSTISDCLLEATDLRRFRGVCRSWRSSVMPIQNKHIISPLYPLGLSSCSWFVRPADNVNFPFVHDYHCQSHLQYRMFANAVYHLRSSSNKANWIVYVQESEPGKLLLRHPLTSEPIPGSSGCGLNMNMSGWSLTRLSISHKFCTPCDCLKCYQIAKTKVVFDDKSEPIIGVFDYFGISALRRCLSTDAGQVVNIGKYSPDFVNFNGCIYVADDDSSALYEVDGTSFQLLPLTCVNSHAYKRCFRKRFLVSDGDLYLVCSFCIEAKPRRRPRRHEILVYKLVINNIARCYSFEKVENLGDRVFFLGKDCSFSVSARDLPPPLVGNCILVARYAFHYCSCFSGFYAYHLGDKPAKMVTQLYPALFEPPLVWTHQVEDRS